MSYLGIGVPQPLASWGNIIWDGSDQVATLWWMSLFPGLFMVLTVMTVAAWSVHMAVPFAITVALVIATIKGSLVASIFMHLSHERKIIYASLVLTVVFFVFLIFIPLFTQKDHIGKPVHVEVPAAGEAHSPSH